MGEQAIRSLETIFTQAIHLAADRLCDMNIAGLEVDEFDRGARSVGVLLRAAQQATLLKDKVERDANADAKTVEIAPLSAAQIAALKADIEEKYVEILQSEDIRKSTDAPEKERLETPKAQQKAGVIDIEEGAREATKDSIKDPRNNPRQTEKADN